MGKTVNFNEEERYIVAQAIQDLRDSGNSMISSHWAQRKIGNDALDRIVRKLEHRVDDSVTTAASPDLSQTEPSKNASEES